MTVQALFVSIDVSDEELHRLQAILTPEERARAARYSFEIDRRRSIVSRGTLREQLEKRLGKAAILVDDPHGKPQLESRALEFNVSHSGDLIVLAFDRRAVGVDLERVRSLGEEAVTLAREHFSPAEIHRMKEAANREREFFAIWTAKEAVVKAIGTGLSSPLQSFSVPALSISPAPVVGLEMWSVRELRAPRPGYCCALATASEPPRSPV